MPNHKRTIWDNERIMNKPPAIRTVKLEYPSVLTKVELSLKFDVSNFEGCILDPNKPIEINGNRVPIPNLPAELIKLKFVELSEVDVTKFVKSSQSGEINKIVVNYKVRKEPLFFGKIRNKVVGTLALALNVYWTDQKCDKGHEIPFGAATCPICHPPPAKQKFCMWHGEPVPAGAKSCPYIRGPPFETVLTPTTTKKCVNPDCGRTIHIRSVYCEYSGTKQPIVNTSTNTATTNSTTTSTTTPSSSPSSHPPHSPQK